MVKYGELDRAMSVYTCAEVPEKIPVEYYRRVIRIAIRMHNDGKHWDMQQAAAVLVYMAFHGGHLHPSQLTASGLEALDHADKLLQENKVIADLADEMSRQPVNIIKLAK
jgi:hypothetical protein